MKKTVFRGRLFKVTTKRTRLPNGRVAHIEFVEHPGAVLIIPLLARNRLILLKQYRPVIGSFLYELPAGTLEKGESPAACARRELIEETGHAAGKLTRLQTIFPVPGYSTERIVIYKAEVLRASTGAAEADEVIYARAFDKTAIRTLFRSGKITDAKTICALALCGWLAR